MKSSPLALAGLLSTTVLLASCGGGSSPAQPAPAVTPIATPTPAPTPTPKPLSVIPACPLASSNPATPKCTEPRPQLEAQVRAAIGRVQAERPELFNFEDLMGGPRILDYQAYMTAVVAAVNEGGSCGKVDAEGEIGIKVNNSYNEQWIIASRAGWNPPAGNWVMYKYVGACAPSTF